MYSEDKKLKERIILLMRLYWRDEIHKIGTELDIDEIKKVENYWDLDHYKGALLISKVLNDEDLKELVSKYPPKYVQMGGFQGQYYTVDKKGRFSFINSWPSVRGNVKKSLENWGDKTYGVLKALVNKNGNSAYFELIDEIGRVLGKEYVPSWILPRLEPLKLVFKTGSNKYPRWTIPTEIIPVIESELKEYTVGSKGKEKSKKFGKGPSKDEEKESLSLLLIERKLDKLVTNLVERKREINIICKRKYKTRFFRDNEKAIMSIKRPCSNEEEFDHRVQGLSSIIDEIETEKIKKQIKSEDNGSINIMKSLLRSNDEKNYGDILNNLRMLRVLRNKKFPTHSDNGKFIEATANFGQDKFPPDWEILWESVLEGTVKSLERFRNALQ
ncbi:MAG: hypothetical protein ACE5H1_03895 [Thermodesulfobacteriota bacterium]